MMRGLGVGVQASACSGLRSGSRTGVAPVSIFIQELCSPLTSWERWRLAGRFRFSAPDWPARRQRSQKLRHGSRVQSANPNACKPHVWPRLNVHPSLCKKVKSFFRPCPKYANGQGEEFRWFRHCGACRSLNLEGAQPCVVRVAVIGRVFIVAMKYLTGGG